MHCAKLAGIETDEATKMHDKLIDAAHKALYQRRVFQYLPAFNSKTDPAKEDLKKAILEVRKHFPSEDHQLPPALAAKVKAAIRG